MSELKHQTVEVEWKAASGTDTGELEGYLAVFNNRDEGGDVIVPGAFTKTINDLANAKSPLPLQAGHDPSPRGNIGSFTSLSQDAHGLKVRAKFASTPDAQAVRQKMIEGHVTGLSIGYRIFKYKMGQQAGEPTRYLLELGLLEGSVTPIPMNRLAVASAKAIETKGVLSDEDAQQLYVWIEQAETTIEQIETLFEARLGIADDDAPQKALARYRGCLLDGIMAKKAAEAGTDDGPATPDDAADPVGTPELEYPFRLLAEKGLSNSEPHDGALDDEPQNALIAQQDRDASNARIAELEARLRAS